MPDFRTLEQLAESSERLLPAVRFSEASRLGGLLSPTQREAGHPKIESHYKGGDFLAREIGLHKLPFGAKLVSSASFEVDVSGVRVLEQSHPLQLQGRRDVTSMPDSGESMRIEGEHLIIGRWGHRTWGHWLGELLPKLALVEATYPGRFKYVSSVMPFASSISPEVRDAWTSYRESLESLGIDETRISKIPRERSIQFESLYGVDAVYVDGIFNPLALAVMRDRVLTGRVSTDSSISAISRAGHGRGINNYSEVLECIRGFGFKSLELSKLTFGEQVTYFSGASKIVGVLGSGLTGAIFSPRGIEVLALGPERFGDRFFYGIVRARQGTFFDLRDKSDGKDAKLSQFDIDMEDLTTMMKLFSPYVEF